MKKIFLFSVIVLLSTLVGCSKDTENEPLPSDDEGKTQPEWTKSDNFVLVQLAKASNTLGCTLTDVMTFENEGWAVTDEITYVHLEKTIDNVDVVMNCYMSGGIVYHTTCSLSPAGKGTVLDSLSYVKEAAVTLTSQLVLTTSETCDFRLMRYKEISSDKFQTVTSFDEAMAAINMDDYSYIVVWADQASTNYEDLSDAIWFGTVSGLNMGIAKSPGTGCIVSMEIASKLYK